MDSSANNAGGRQRLHFGSIEEIERKTRGTTANTELVLDRMKALEDYADLEVEEMTGELSLEQERMLAEMERKKRARTLAVPTDDLRVRAKLREFEQPITLFGEGPAERRDRLRELMEKAMSDDDMMSDSEASLASDESQDEEFFTLGPEGLLTARQVCLEHSLAAASRRLEAQRRELDLSVPRRRKMKHDHYLDLKTFGTVSAQIGDDRPLTYCAFSPNSKLIATAAWSGTIKTWHVPSSEQAQTWTGHTERVSGLDWNPVQNSNVCLVSGAVDGSVNLWSAESQTPVGNLVGHDMRVCRVGFHPSGRYAATTSFDATWRLWDIETQAELLLQEGHSKEVYALGFHPDGSLIGTGGMDALSRIWDLRSGRSILALKGHVKQILSLDFSPDGYTVATGSEDNSIKIWDLRKGECTHTIPAHKNIVTQCKFWKADGNWPVAVEAMDVDGSDDKDNFYQRQVLNGSWLVSSSYDGTCKIWSGGDWKLLKSISGLEGKIMCCDASRDGRFIATAAYDRTFKLYAPEAVAMTL